MRLEADIDASRQTTFHDWNWCLPAAGSPARPSTKLNLTGSGYPQSHALTLLATGTGSTLPSSLSTAAGSRTSGHTRSHAPNSCRRASLAGSLQQAVTGQDKRHAQASLPQTCWSSEASRFCLQAATTAAGRKAAFELEALPLATLAGLLPTGGELQGMLQGEGSYQQADQPGRHGTHAALTTTAGELTVASAIR